MLVCVCVCVIILVEYSHEYSFFSRAGEEPFSLGVHSEPPVVLSFSHFVTGCCANGFYDPFPFSSFLPSLLH